MSEYFGQAAPGAESESVPAPARRVSINNRKLEPATGAEAADFAGASRSRAGAPVRTEATLVRAEAALPPTEFQRFILESTGKLLPVFGADFFKNAPSTFAPIGNSPVPGDYILGPGDELLVRGWGSIDIDYRAKIDRNGLISIPTVGSVVLAGVKASAAEGVIRGAVSRLYKGVTLNVNFGQLRAIKGFKFSASEDLAIGNTRL